MSDTTTLKRELIKTAKLAYLTEYYNRCGASVPLDVGIEVILIAVGMLPPKEEKSK